MGSKSILICPFGDSVSNLVVLHLVRRLCKKLVPWAEEIEARRDALAYCFDMLLPNTSALDGSAYSESARLSGGPISIRLSQVKLVEPLRDIKSNPRCMQKLKS
jgi:hypothetical protein